MLADIDIAQGRLHQAAECWQEALQFLETHGWQFLPVAGEAHVGMGAVMYEWNDLDAATRYLTTGIALASKGGEAEILVSGYAAFSRVLRAQGDGAGALRLVRKTMQFIPEARLTALQIRIYLARGNLAAASRWARTCGLHPDDDPNYVHEYEYLTLTRVLIAEDRATETLGLLDRLKHAAECGERTGSVIEILVLQSLAYYALGDTVQALSMLEQALTLAEPEDYVRIIIDEGSPMEALLLALRRMLRRRQRRRAHGILSVYVTRLLEGLEQRAGGTQAVSIEGQGKPSRMTQRLVEPLSERERDVLRLLAAGLSNGEIAQKLVVAPSTIKAHIHNIYGKLAVRNRTRAIALARDLNLVDQ